MITVNGRNVYDFEGKTVAEIIKSNYPYAKIYVKLNGRHIEPDEYPDLVLAPGDQLQVIHLMAGG